MPREENQEVLVIPNDERGTIDALSRRHEVARIAVECATARYKNAVKAGDVELAIQEFDTGKSLEADCNHAVDAFWTHVRTLFPEVTNGKEWTIDRENYTIVRRSGSMMDMLADLVR